MAPKFSIDIKPFNIGPHYGICLFLVFCCLCLFWQVHDFDFVNYDDGLYVYENPQVRQGVTLKGIGWSFTATDGGNWHPLTWWSHMVDVQIYGVDPGRHHMTGVLLHILNTLLVFLVFRQMTRRDRQSAMVAILFAIHPTHVESVVWVSERKDVLSAFFWMLTIWAYFRYVQKPDRMRYLWVAVFFALGLMAKPMLVTLPFVLLLLDFWPLGRFCNEKTAGFRKTGSSVFALVGEKIPLFLLSSAVGIVTVFAQHHSGALGSLEVYSLSVRVANALVSYVLYLKKMIWPFGLALPYPHPGSVPIWQSAAALLLLAAVTYGVITSGRRHPYLWVGWLWYIGTLVPVIGFVQVGSQAMADRYTYIPFIGLFIIVAWGWAELASKRRTGMWVSPAIGAAVCGLLAVIAWVQTGYWQNSTTLFTRAIDVTEKNYAAHNNLGIAFAEKGRFTEAVHYYSEGLKINPHYSKLHNNLGNVFLKMGRIDAAVDHFRRALQINPAYAKAHLNMGNALLIQEKTDDAIEHLQAALQGDPNDPTARNNLAYALQIKGRLDEAIAQYRAALRIIADDATLYNNLGVALMRKGDGQEALLQFQKALALRSGYPDAQNNLKIALASLGEAPGPRTEPDLSFRRIDPVGPSRPGQ